MAAAAILINTQKNVSQPILDQFVVAFLEIQNGVAAILNKNQLLVYLGQYCILISTKQHR